jgi:hypothetical protein
MMLMDNDDIARFTECHASIEMLYRKKRLGECCPICLSEDGHVYCITRCGHIFCRNCFLELWVRADEEEVEEDEEEEDEERHKCPTCRHVFQEPIIELSFLSSKSKWIIDQIRHIIEGGVGGLAGGCVGRKIVVLSSCEGTLLWLHQALRGLEIESTFCRQFDKLTINNFLDSSTNRVLVMPISALQREIILHPHSQLIVPEEMVYDVKRYVFKNLGIRHFRQNYLIC